VTAGTDDRRGLDEPGEDRTASRRATPSDVAARVRGAARWSGLRGFALAGGVCAVAAALTVWQAPHVTRAVFIFFWPAVLIIAWFGGRVPGLAAVAFAIAAVSYFVLPPRSWTAPWPVDEWMPVVLFLVVGVVMTELASGLRRVERRAVQAEAEASERAQLLEDQAIELEAQKEEAQVLAEELEQTNEELQQTNDQLGVALADAERGAEAESAAATRAQRLLALSTALSDAVTLDDVADIILRDGMTAVGADAAALAALDGAPGPEPPTEFVVLRRAGYAPALKDRWQRFPLHAGRPLSDAVLSRQPVLIESLAEWRARYPEMAEQTPELTLEAMANIPIVSQGRPIAGLSFSFRSARRFDDATRTFFATVGEQCGIALGRARAFEAERRGRERSAFLSEASRLLATSLEYERTLEALALAAVPRLGDWCAVDMLDHPGVAEWPPRISRLAVVHQDPAKIAMAKELQERLPTDWSSPTGLARVLREGVTEFYPEIPDAMLVAAAKTPEHLALLRELQLSAIIIVPLVARGVILGAFTLVMSESGRHYDRADQALAEDLAQRAAIAVDNARLYREAERARAAAEEANRAKGAFLAMMSHELRTPLNAIAGYTELLEMEIHGPLTTAQRDSVRRVQRSEQALLSLVEDVLSFARIESGRMEYQLTDVPLDATLAELEDLVRPQLSAKSLVYRCLRLDPAVTVWADRDKLEQILLNLLTNAIKFTEEGEIVIECDTTENDVSIHVRDTGIGIAEEKIDLIFEPFVQVQSALTRTTQGSGLGLAISRDLARGMGGDLTVRSEVGKGSTFTLRLPRRPG
jgi:signal transduction histidine kinase